MNFAIALTVVTHVIPLLSIYVFANIAKEITVCSVSLTDSIVDNWEISSEDYIRVFECTFDSHACYIVYIESIIDKFEI